MRAWSRRAMRSRAGSSSARRRAATRLRLLAGTSRSCWWARMTRFRARCMAPACLLQPKPCRRAAMCACGPRDRWAVRRWLWWRQGTPPPCAPSHGPCRITAARAGWCSTVVGCSRVGSGMRPVPRWRWSAECVRPGAAGSPTGDRREMSAPAMLDFGPNRPPGNAMQPRHLILSTALVVSSFLSSAHADEAAFASCLAGLRADAQAKGVSGATYDTHTAALAPDMAVIDFLDAQPEFVTPIWDYLAALVDDERVADGRAMLAEWAPVLARVEAEYGVDAATVVAVW